MRGAAWAGASREAGLSESTTEAGLALGAGLTSWRVFGISGGRGSLWARPLWVGGACVGTGRACSGAPKVGSLRSRGFQRLRGEVLEAGCDPELAGMGRCALSGPWESWWGAAKAGEMGWMGRGYRGLALPVPDSRSPVGGAVGRGRGVSAPPV